jgi:hypothetical protein
MGQDRKIRESRHQDELNLERIADDGRLVVTDSPKISFSGYDFKTELEGDARNERRLLWAEVLIVGGIIGFVLLRNYLLSS